jgi:2-polyprenyl-3-methyl-5-hydroxy-6-metoxy-1,4-benzoquinol methylase
MSNTSAMSDSKLAAGEGAYEAKNDKYFAGARKDYVDEFPASPKARILEVGCGNGDTGAYALKSGKCGTYCGVEICERPAQMARGQLSEVLLGDAEKLDMPWPAEYFNGLILSEVLEHLVDPWAVLRKLRPLMAKGALIFASSPNVTHHSVVRMMLRGRWDLADKGIMDRTHLRWFTIQSYRDMFESTGYRVDRAGPLSRPGWKGKMINIMTLGRFTHMFAQQVSLRAHCE